MQLRRLSLMLSFFFLTAPALANDSTAALETGGLVLTKSLQIEMRSEDLFISNKIINIRYLFINHSSQDISTIVAFPMPRISNDRGTTIEIPNGTADNFLEFSTSVNGQPVAARAERRAYKDDREITSILRADGVPLAPHQQKTQDALNRLPESKQREFIKDNLVEAEKSDMGKGTQRTLVPRWSLATTYYFDVLFPAGKETIIEHQYRPSVGLSNVTSLGDPKEMSKPWFKDEKDKYCIDQTLLRKVQTAKKPPHMEYGSPFTEERISYILSTGANWARPIARFNLVIDKSSPDNLISLCGDGVIKISPTLVEISKSNFTPKTDINILILKPFPKNN